MEALYERVLARVPTPQLHENYNAVLREEFTSVSQTLSDMIAAFAKLGEVHDAVSKLQRSDKPSSDSLRTDNTMDLQCQLLHLVDKLAVGMEVAQVERKRKRVEEEEEATAPSVAVPVPNSGGENNGRASCKGASNNAKRVKADVGSGSKGEEVAGSESSSLSESDSDDDYDESCEDADDAEGSEAAWKALTKTKGNLSASSLNTKASPSFVKDTTKQMGSKTSTTAPRKSATYLKTIVEVMNKEISPINKSFIIPDVVTALKDSVEEDVDGQQSSCVASTLEILVGWWVRQSEYQAQYAGMYRGYAAVIDFYAARLPSSACKSELKRLTRLLKEIISSTIESLGGPQMPSSTKAIVDAAAKQCKKSGGIASVIGNSDVPLPHEKQIKRLLDLLVAFRKETAGGVNSNGTSGGRIPKALTKMRRWLGGSLRKPDQLLLYRVIVDAMQKVWKQIPSAPTRKSVVGLLGKMSDTISNSSNSINALSGLHDRATQVCKEVMLRRKKCISPTEAHALMETVQTLLNDQTPGWNPRGDVIIRKCVHELKNILVHAQSSCDINSWGKFEACYAMMAKWKVEALPAEFQ